MAIAFDASNSNTNHGGGTTVTVTLTPTAGALIIAAVTLYVDNDSITGVSSNVDGAFTQAANLKYRDDYDEIVALYYFEDSAGGAATITATAGGLDWLDITVMSFTGVATSSSIIGSTVTNTGTGNSISSGAKTDFTVNDLAIGAFASDDAAGTTLGAGSGWTSPEGVVGGGNTSYQVVDATTETATCSNSGSGVWGAILAGFSEAAAAGVAPTGVLQGPLVGPLGGPI